MTLVMQGLLGDADKGGYAVSAHPTASSWPAATAPIPPRSPGSAAPA